jgi:hypothetical protein
MARPQVANREEGPQLWRVTPNIIIHGQPKSGDAPYSSYVILKHPVAPHLIYTNQVCTIVYENCCSAGFLVIRRDKSAWKCEFSIWTELHKDGEAKIIKVESISEVKWRLTITHCNM